MILKKGLLVLAALIAAALPASADGADSRKMSGGHITEETVWSGEYTVTGPVTVDAGVTLTVKPGTRISFRGKEARLFISGALTAEGTEEDPITFTRDPRSEEGVKWGGVALQSAAKPARFSYCTFSGAKTALATVKSSLSLEDCTFEQNGVAVDINMESVAEISKSTFTENEVGLEVRLKSAVKVEKCLFENNSKFAAALSNGAGGRITGSTFREGGGVLIKQGTNIFLGNNVFSMCRNGIVADQVKHDVRISGNRFEGGEQGIVAVNFSTPWIACSEFRGLDTAVVVTKFSNPLIQNSLFEGNKKAVFANQKSSFPITRNVFRENEVAVHVDLSAYPVISENNFDSNGKDIELGIYMSADWEEKVGSGAISGRQAQQRGSRNLGGVQQPREFPGKVDARRNWWGEKTTAEMEKLGPEGNVGTIDDYFDRNEVTYPRFGGGSYRLDRVMYDSWEKEPVAEAGPLPEGCGDIKKGDGGGREK